MSGLTSLEELRLHSNSITDISAVRRLTNLTLLQVSDNAVTDIGNELKPKNS